MKEEDKFIKEVWIILKDMKIYRNTSTDLQSN
jgi:hypothetical protein